MLWALRAAELASGVPGVSKDRDTPAVVPSSGRLAEWCGLCVLDGRAEFLGRSHQFCAGRRQPAGAVV